MQTDVITPRALEGIRENDGFFDDRPRRLHVASLDVLDDAIDQMRLIHRAIGRARKSHHDVDAVADLIVAAHADVDRLLTG